MDFLQQLSGNPKLIQRINENVTTLKEDFVAIKRISLLPLTDKNFNDAFQLFVNIFDYIPLMVTELTIPQVVRGRPHYKEDSLVSEKSQVSYNWKYRDEIKLGRFNRQCEPLFYGSLPTESKNIDYVLSCALECCKELSLEYKAPDVQDITVSGWKLKQSFSVVTLCFDEMHLNENPSLNDAVHDYWKGINENLSQEAAEFVEVFLRYFSELSRTTMPNNESYMITTALFNAIRYYYETFLKRTVHGLIYPSAMSMAKGLNVVLTREAVDRFLKLDKVVMYRYSLVKPERTTFVAHKCSDIIKVTGKNFAITNYIPAGGYSKENV